MHPGRHPGGRLRGAARLDARDGDLQRPLRDATEPRPHVCGREREAVDAFIAEQEATHAARAEAAGVGDEERWVDYRLLQVFDRLSLTLCLHEWEGSDAEPCSLAPLPVDYDGGEAELRMEPLGPWRIRVDPYPFTESPARFRLVRKVLPQAAYSGNEDFRLAYFATRAEAVELTFQR